MKQRKRVTIMDIAGRLGISYSTVSRALSDNPKVSVHPATRERVLKAASKLGYYPNLMARAMSTRKTGVLGLITVDSEADPILASYVKNIIVEAHRHGYQIMVEIAVFPDSEDPLDDQQVQIRQMISRGVDGLLVQVRGTRDEARGVSDAVEGTVPVVAFSRSLEGFSSVVLDRTAGTYEATEHLIRLGHRRIGFVGRWNRDEMLVTSTSVVKWSGYLHALQAHGLAPERIEADGPTLEAGYRMGLRLGRTSNRPTAFVCWGDMPAIGMCRGLREAGVRVPEEVGVVGFDGLEVGAYCAPPLTTVAHSLTEICREAVGLLIGQLSGEAEVKSVMVRPRLIVRESCGAGCDRSGLESAGV